MFLEVKQTSKYMGGSDLAVAGGGRAPDLGAYTCPSEYSGL